MIKRNLKWFGTQVLMIMCVVTVTACGSGSENDDDDYGGGYVGSTSDLYGVWTGYTSDSQNAVVLGFSNSGTGVLQKIYYNAGIGQTVQEDMVSFAYSFNEGNGVLNVNYTENKSGSARFQVLSLMSEAMTIQIDGKTYQCERYHEDTDSGSGGSTTDYAPRDVSGTHLLIHLHSYSLDLYFNSNYSVDMKYSRMTTPFTLADASYSKTGTNTAIVSYTWSGSTGTHTESVTLTFTSASGGTARGDAVSGSFTIEEFSKSSSAAAPGSIAYMTLHVPYGTDKWYKFGSQTGNHVSITSHSGSLSYYSIYATYSRTGTTTATITIYERYSEYTSTSESTYTLDFYTSTSGKYSYYHRSGSFGSSSWTGDFTLQ